MKSSVPALNVGITAVPPAMILDLSEPRKRGMRFGKRPGGRDGLQHWSLLPEVKLSARRKAT